MVDFWDQFRNPYSSINLVDVFLHIHGGADYQDYPEAMEFLQETMDLQPIISRQVAAVAIAFASVLEHKG